MKIQTRSVELKIHKENKGMFNRGEVIDKNFIRRVGEGDLPPIKEFPGNSPDYRDYQTESSIGDSSRAFLDLSPGDLSPGFAGEVRGGDQSSQLSSKGLENLKKEELVDLFETQVMSRLLDLKARELREKNLCYYTIGSSGHEGNAALALALRLTDPAFLHYRSAAFFIQRAKKKTGSTPLRDLLLSFTASKEDPISGGRHKVLGSKELFIPPQTSTIASHLPKALGAALSIPKARELNISGDWKEDSLVVCSFGDASANHSTALGAINTACLVAYQNIKLPLIFFCEDNGLGISVKTPKNWIRENFKHRPNLLYLECDGLNLIDVYHTSQKAVSYARQRNKPVFVRMKTIRLLGHAGSDVEIHYHSPGEIEKIEAHDPLLYSAGWLFHQGLLSSSRILEIYQNIKEKIHEISMEVIQKKPLTTISEVKASLTACENKNEPVGSVSDEKRKEVFGKNWEKLKEPQPMAKLLNWGLRDILLQYPQSLVFGEDVAEKGGVYNVTGGLKKIFGNRRVFDSPLDEQSILGSAIGLAHNGFIPIPEIQFLAYVHNAEDQIRGEAATLAFFSKGQFTNPMIIRIAGLAYQKGFGGHFHNDNSLAVFRDIPGLILAVPAHGADGVRMLRTCMKEALERGRVCIFIEPIARYNTRDLFEQGDKLWSFPYPEIHDFSPLGEFGVYGSASQTVIITYGNGTYLSLQAQKKLKDKHNIHCQIIDLKWISPIDYKKLYKQLEGAERILFVEECRQTGSLAEGVISQLATCGLKSWTLKIHAGADCFISLGPSFLAGLPGCESIVGEILHLDAVL